MQTMVSVHSPLISRNRWTTDLGKHAFLSSDALKIIALVTMFIDHVAAVLLPYDTTAYAVCRFIGRLAFPIYAFLLTEGYLYTKNKGTYITRLLLFAFISEIIYNLTNNDTFFTLKYQNIFFELATGLFSIYVYEEMHKNRGRFLALTSVFIIAIIAEVLNFDYGFIGIIVIMSFFWFRRNLAFKNMAFIFIVFYYYFSKYYLITESPSISLIYVLVSYNPYMIMGALPISFYNGKKGKIKLNKYFFYIFYPLHLLLLYIIKIIVL